MNILEITARLFEINLELRVLGDELARAEARRSLVVQPTDAVTEGVNDLSGSDDLLTQDGDQSEGNYE